jgi:hypothetical protein
MERLYFPYGGGHDCLALDQGISTLPNNFVWIKLIKSFNDVLINVMLDSILIVRRYFHCIWNLLILNKF